MHFINPYISFYTEAKGFQFYSAFPFCKEVAWTFLKHLGNKLGLFRHRVNITFVDSAIQTGTRRFGSIYDYRIKVDEPLLLTRTEEERRDLLLNIIYEAFCALANEYAWDLKAIDQAYQKAKNENRGFNFLSAYKSSRDRNHTGALAFELVESNLKIYCTVQDKTSNSLLRFKLIETDEDNFSWSRRIKEYGWYDNNRFGLKFLNGDYWIVYDVLNQKTGEIICPKKHSMKEVESFKRELEPLRTTTAKKH